MARAGVLDRDRLEEAANAYFAQLVREVDQPRDFPADDYDNALAVQIEQSENEIERYDGHLTAHSYGCPTSGIRRCNAGGTLSRKGWEAVCRFSW